MSNTVHTIPTMNYESHWYRQYRCVHSIQLAVYYHNKQLIECCVHTYTVYTIPR